MSDSERLRRIRTALVELAPQRLDLVDRLAEFYDESVVFEDPIQRLEGREAFLAMNRRLASRARIFSFDLRTAVESGDEIFLTWTMRYAYKRGPVATGSGVSHLRLRSDKVVYHRDYWDIGELVSSTIPGGRKVLGAILRPFA